MDNQPVSEETLREENQKAAEAGRELQATSRRDWHTYFMHIAREVSKRSTCNRKFVGAVIVRDKNILSTGYNGSIRSQPHCDYVGHLMHNGHCIRTVHAEANSIIQAARHGVNIDKADL